MPRSSGRWTTGRRSPSPLGSGPNGCCSSTACAGSTPGCGSPRAIGCTPACARRWRPASSSARATATVTGALVRRAVIAPSAAGGATSRPVTPTYAHVPTVGDDPGAAYLAIHARMTALEHEVVGSGHGAELVVFDGPLRGRVDPFGVGYVKTQHVQYVPDEAVGVLGRLGDGERTPLMLIGERCWSWYLRLPGLAWPSAVRGRALRAAGGGVGGGGRSSGPTSCRRACPASPARPTRSRGRRRTWCRSPGSSNGCATCSATRSCSSGRCASGGGVERQRVAGTVERRRSQPP